MNLRERTVLGINEWIKGNVTDGKLKASMLPGMEYYLDFLDEPFECLDVSLEDYYADNDESDDFFKIVNIGMNVGDMKMDVNVQVFLHHFSETVFIEHNYFVFSRDNEVRFEENISHMAEDYVELLANLGFAEFIQKNEFIISLSEQLETDDCEQIFNRLKNHIPNIQEVNPNAEYTNNYRLRWADGFYLDVNRDEVKGALNKYDWEQKKKASS